MANHKPTGSSTIKFGAFIQNKAYTISESQLLQGFSDADGDKMTVPIPEIDATQGTLTVDPKNKETWIFKPAKDFAGEVKVDYVVSDKKSFVSGETSFVVEGAVATHNKLVHTGALFAVLSYGEYSLWADQFTENGWSSYSGSDIPDEGFDDNYTKFFEETKNLGETWELLTDKNGLGEFTAQDKDFYHAKFTDDSNLTKHGYGLYHGWIDSVGSSSFDQYHEITQQGGFIQGKFSQVTEKFGNSNALVAKNSDTLVLAFRGTDGLDSAFLGGQAFTGDGEYLHYEAFRPLIDAVYNYAKTHSDIKHIVVSGHSLGGAMADIFTAVDGKRFDDLTTNDLTVVSMASAGLDPDAFNDENDTTSFFNRYDKSIVQDFYLDYISKLRTPDYYVGLAHDKDRVYHSLEYRSNNSLDAGAGLLPVDTLMANAHFVTTKLNLPNVGNLDVDYPGSVWIDNGFGAHHNGLIYYANLDALYSSSLINNYSNQSLIFGIDSYTNQGEWFTEGNPVDDYNSLAALDRRLLGSDKADFILGLAGNDVLEGKNGNDLLDGGTGNDTITGGTGSDKMVGGAGNDIFIFTSTLDSAIDKLRDVISDFVSGIDKIDLSGIDANTTKEKNAAGNNIFILEANNTIQSGGANFAFNRTNALYFDTDNHILYGNVDANNKPDFSIQLVGVSSLEASDFIL